jgi:hypothetical protein
MDNAADRKSIRRKEKAAHLADVQRREVIANVMSTTYGRQWIWELLSNAHIFVTTFTGEPHSSAFQEGQRAMGLALLADIMIHCPDQYIQAQRESNERYIAANSANDSDSGPADGERRSGEEPDGGDLGRESAAGTEASNFGSDIYAADPGSKA